MHNLEYKEHAKKSIDTIFAKIDEWDAKKDLVKAHAKVEYNEIITDLKLKKIDLQAKFKELKEAREDKWEDVKTAFSSASESFKGGFSKIASLF